jgi:hypothetical protein
MSEKSIEVCPICGVKIEGENKVLFSAGSPGSRSRLWVRVCQYIKKPGCINQDKKAIGEIQPNDYYGDVEDLPLSPPKPTPKPLTAVVSEMLESRGNSSS